MTIATPPVSQSNSSGAAPSSNKPHVVMVIPRGEALRNFLFSETLEHLAKSARVTLLSVITDDKFTQHFSQHADGILPLDYQGEHKIVNHVRHLLSEAHFKWLGSEVARNHWDIETSRAKTSVDKVKLSLRRALMVPLANRPILRTATKLEQFLTYRLKPTDRFDKLFADLKPDLVFNGSHIHGAAGTLPIRVAHEMGIPTAGFVFSWDNLTSRSRILEPYDFFLVWHNHMKQQLLDIYAKIKPAQVFVTGTPQFDFHYKLQYELSREELAEKIGIDPARPFVLYTAGIDRHFPHEHTHVEFIIDYLSKLKPKPQLVVRTYIKGISEEMQALAKANNPDVVFPPVLWEKQWRTPMHEDLAIYSNLLRHCVMGINPASTVSLELMLHDKPVMNIGFDPPKSHLPHEMRWSRHIDFDHYKPVAESGAVRVAWSTDDMAEIMTAYLANPALDSAERAAFVKKFFDPYVPNGEQGVAVADELVRLALKVQS